MENSYRSSMSKAVSPNNKPTNTISDDHQCSEESGWTAYFQEFSDRNNIIYNNNNNIIIDHQESTFSCTSSLVSDAASYAAWNKISHNNHHHPRAPAAGRSASPPIKTPKKLTFKKTRTKEISADDSLEDTASSPVNSPKVGDLKLVHNLRTKQTDNLVDHSSLGKRGTSENYPELQQEETSVVDFNGKNDCIDLKKRGLCLVPLSMLVNYLG